MSAECRAPADTDIGARLAAVRARIAAAEQRFARVPGSVRLIAVSKYQPPASLMAAHECGQRDFGESYLQEGLDKKRALADRADLQWHFIGRIQSNKTRQIAEHFDWVHGLASIAHARRLGAQRPTALGALPVCVQINLGGEASKAGIAPEEAERFIAEVERIDGLVVAGLMTLPPFVADFALQRRIFATLRELRARLARADRPLATLSMGMSLDLEAAIAEGATMVRVGTAVFGERAPA